MCLAGDSKASGLCVFKYPIPHLEGLFCLMLLYSLPLVHKRALIREREKYAGVGREVEVKWRNLEELSLVKVEGSKRVYLAYLA